MAVSGTTYDTICMSRPIRGFTSDGHTPPAHGAYSVQGPSHRRPHVLSPTSIMEVWRGQQLVI